MTWIKDLALGAMKCRPGDPTGEKFEETLKEHGCKVPGGSGIPQADIDAAFAALAEKGVTVPDGATSADLDDLIASIVTGGGGGAISTGEIVFAEDSYTLTFAHNLGTVPSWVITIKDPAGPFVDANETLAIYSTSKYGLRVVQSATGTGNTKTLAGYYIDQWAINGGNFVVADESKVTIAVPSATMRFFAGGKHRVVCGAEV